MTDMRYKPLWLPQVSAPFSYVLGKLKDDGVKYKLVNINPKNIIPSQGIVFSDKVSDIDPHNMKPIWMSNDNYAIDGHHRYCSGLSHELPYIKAVKIDLNKNDAARILNKIMDIHEYESQKQIEEVVAQDQINDMNDPDTDPQNFLKMLEDENEVKIMGNDIVGGKKKKTKGYRKDTVKENSAVGNFFSLKAIEGYKLYELEFNNILDTNDLDIIYRADQNPTNILAKNWFPNINFVNIAKKYEVNPTILINRAIAEKAKMMNYDGIKYGDIMIQMF